MSASAAGMHLSTAAAGREHLAPPPMRAGTACCLVGFSRTDITPPVGIYNRCVCVCACACEYMRGHVHGMHVHLCSCMRATCFRACVCACVRANACMYMHGLCRKCVRPHPNTAACTRCRPVVVLHQVLGCRGSRLRHGHPQAVIRQCDGVCSTTRPPHCRRRRRARLGLDDVANCCRRLRHRLLHCHMAPTQCI